MDENKKFRYFPLFDVPIFLEDIQVVKKYLLELIDQNIGGDIHLCNSYTLSLACESSLLMEVLKSSSLNIPDGWPVVLAGRKYGLKVPIRGSDLFRIVISIENPRPLKNFFLGGGVSHMEPMILKMRESFPNLIVVGSHSPDFKDFVIDDYVLFSKIIKKTGAEIVWVGLGTPKQDLAIHELRKLCPGIVFISIGAVFDFWSGKSKEAPKIIRKFRLEWLFRFIQEPRKLWKRYLIFAPKFLFQSVKFGNKINVDLTTNGSM